MANSKRYTKISNAFTATDRRLARLQREAHGRWTASDDDQGDLLGNRECDIWRETWHAIDLERLRLRTEYQVAIYGSPIVREPYPHELCRHA